MDMTHRLSMTYKGDHPADVACNFESCSPSIRGIDGPQISTSMTPVCRSSSLASAHPSAVVKVDLPTPPLPDRMRIFLLTVDMRFFTAGRSGSGPFGAVWHASWFGQPAHADALPASSDSVPVKCQYCDTGRSESAHKSRSVERWRNVEDESAS